MNQLIDIITVTILGIFLASFSAYIIWYNAKSFPREDARTLKIWALGLSLQPVAWLVFSYRGNEPDPTLSIIANILIIAGFSLLAKATREFLNAENKDRFLIINLICVGVAIGIFTVVWSNFSAMVIINGLGSLIAFIFMLLPLFHSLRENNSPPQKIVFSAILLGVFILLARVLNHIVSPRVGGNFLEPSIEDSFAVIYAATGPVLASFGFLLLHQERAYKKLKLMADKDSLTGLLNRQAFERLANQHYAIANNSVNPIWVMMIDIDYFKKINDSYGHEVGDAALKQCSLLIENIVNNKDIVGRMGGEEFMVLLPNSDTIVAEQITKDILKTISQTNFTHGDVAINLTVSIGLASKNNDENNFRLTLKRADLAMYKAKRLGRNQIAIAGNNITEENSVTK